MRKITFTLLALFFAITNVISADYFWVNGSGNWSDFANHWATTSGGSTFHAQAPGQFDNVYFDANSFTSAGEIVTIDIVASCASMDWTDALYDPSLAGGSHLSIYGSLTLISAMNYTRTGYTYFEAVSTGQTITMAGHSFNNRIYFQGIGGWELQDDLHVEGQIIYFNNGSLNTNDHAVFVHRFISSVSTVRNLSLGASVITTTYGSYNSIQINGSNLTLDPGTSLIKLTGNNGGMNINGTGNLAFYDVRCESATGSSSILNEEGSFNTIVYNSNGVLQDGNTVDSVTFTGDGTINDHNNNINVLKFNANATINANGSYGKVTIAGNGAITGNNTFDHIEFTAGKTYTLTGTRTQTINNEFIAMGSCTEPITIQSNTVSQTTISKSSGTVTIQYCLLKDNNATGGATYIANNTIDLGNNTGWSINPPAPLNLYWVGGTGDWNDPNHWAVSSGGIGGTCVPSPIDNVFFDANSFGGSGETVTIIGDGNNNANCKNMDWTGATNTPALAGISSYFLRIYGSFKLIPNMSFTFAGKIYLEATNPGNLITSGGHTFNYNDIYFNGVGGEWTLQDGLDTGDEYVYLNNGTLNTNDQPIFVDRFYSTVSTVRYLNLGSSVLTLAENSTNAFNVNGTNLTFDAGTSLIKLANVGGGMNVTGYGNLAFHNVICEAITGTSYIRNVIGSFNTITYNSNGYLEDGNTVDSITFAGNGVIQDNNNNINYLYFNSIGTIHSDGTYGKVIFGGNGNITNDNTFGTIEFTAGNQYTLTNGKTQVIQNNLIANGTPTEIIIIKSSSAGSQSTISKSSPGDVTVEYVSLQDNNATGGATFTANNSYDQGNNTGWFINSPGGIDYYWVGGTGNYNDASQWASSSGGPGGAGVPTTLDNVFFDANSFTAPGQIVTLIGDASHNVNCVDMDWTGATNDPVLAGASTEFLRVYGSLTLNPGMSYTFAGKVYLEATDPGHSLTCAGINLDNNYVYFNGVGGEWTLQDELNVGTYRIYLVNGTLNTNDQPLFADRFYSDNTNVRTLNLGASVITLVEGGVDALNFNGTNLTLDAGTSLIKMTAASGGMNCVGTGNAAFYDVICEAVTGNSYIRNVLGSFNTITYNSNGYLEDGNTVDSVTFAGNGIISDNNNNINYVEFNANATINADGTYGEVYMGGDGNITNDNTFNTLEFSAGHQYTLTYNKTQIIQNDLIANGTATEIIIIKSNSAGNQATFSKSSGAVNVSYVSLQDNNATGGAVFTANNSIDLGNNTGWNINAVGGTDYFWVGGTGDYNDASHWANTTGGAGGAGIPNINDNVFFDANSFNASGQIVSLIGDASHNVNCLNMDWTAATDNPVLAGAATEFLRIYGSLTLIPDMSFNFGGRIYLEATDPGHTVTTAGLLLDNDYFLFNGEGGEWTLQDELNVGAERIYLNYGTLNTNDQALFADRFYSDNTNVRTLNLGASVVTLAEGSVYALTFNGTNLTLDAGTSLIKMTTVAGGMNCIGTGNAAFYDVICEAVTGTSYVRNESGSFNTITFKSNGVLQDGNTVDSVIFTGNGTISDNNNNINYIEFNANATINGDGIYGEVYMYGDGAITNDNTFGTLEFTAGHVYTLSYSKTQIIQNDLVAIGSCIAPITIQSSLAGTQTTISKSSGVITVNRVSLQDNAATGGATFIANNTLDLGNNSGWTIFPVSSENLYWVGGTGNWNDVSHWAATSGGTGGYCLPSQIDNVIFDANSFSQTGQAVYVDITDAECQNMDWTGVNYIPTLTANSNTFNLHLYGSLTLDPAMNYSFQGNLYFEGGANSKAAYTITMNGHNLNNHVRFNGVGGEWELQDDFDAGNSTIYLLNGSLNTNDQTISCEIFNSNNTNTRGLILGSSIINCSDANANAWYVNGSNLTLDAGSSEIRVTSAGGDFISSNSATLLYNNVLFQSTGGASVLNSNAEVNSAIFMGNGEVKGYGTFNFVDFSLEGTINNNNTFGTVLMYGDGNLNGTNSFSFMLMSPGYTYTFQSGFTQTLEQHLFAIGTCAEQIYIRSSSPGTEAYINKTSGNVIINFAYIQDNSATGGATFDAYNSFDQGNNSGWIFHPEEPKDIYWVGGSGDWLDISHWAYSSGATGNYCLPGPEDNVIFDANSFDAPGQTVSIDDPAVEINNMTWTGVTNNPAIIGYAPYFEMFINGSLTLDPNMDFAFEGEIFFNGGGAKEKGTYSITTAGNPFNSNIYFEGAGQEWVIQDELDLGNNNINFVEGILNTNDQTIYCHQFYSSYTNVRGLILGSSEIYLNNEIDFDWDVNGINMTLNAGTSTIYLTTEASGFRSVSGNNLVYQRVESASATGQAMITTDHQINQVKLIGDAEISGGGSFGIVDFDQNGVINNSNSFYVLNLEEGYNYTFESGETQSFVNNILMSGSACLPIYIHSSLPGLQAFISKSTDMSALYVYVRDMNIVGGGEVNCTQSIDLGNNTNWTFSEDTGYDFDFTVNIEGAFNGTNMNTGLIPYMPNDHPFNNPPWNYSTCQTAPVFPSNAVDWIMVELRDAPTAALADPESSVAKIAGFLLDDGSIVGGDGSSPLRIDISPTYNFFPVFYHRNHLPVMSSVPIVEVGNTYTYDFTTGSGTVYGGVDGHKQLAPGIWGMIAGDAIPDGIIDDNDKQIGWEAETGQSGYLQSDFNLQGQSDNADKNDFWLPNDGRGSTIPD